MFDPHVTVAAIIEDQGRFLLVEEWVDDQPRYNQPAGHIEADESIIEAMVRETLEETAYRVEARGLTGLYQWQSPNGSTFFRYAFSARVVEQVLGARLDPDIIRTHWLSLDEIRQLAQKRMMRSPLVLACIEDYLSREAAPLALLRTLD